LNALTFETDYKYTDRETKYKYVSLKYEGILKGKILDVGADQAYLKKHIEGIDYHSIGFGRGVNHIINLEQERIPFGENSFDCVLCLDVLEHLENIHQVFDDLCKVTSKYVIISLPNPWGDFWGSIRHKVARSQTVLKSYGLPLEPPEDRHKWFFSQEEAEKFVHYRSDKNGMKIKQLDYFGGFDNQWGIRRFARLIFLLMLFKGVNLNNLNTQKLWVVLEKSPGGMVSTQR